MVGLDLHPTYRGGRYTLRGLYDSEKKALTKVSELEDDGLRVYAFSEESPASGTWFHVAARHDVSPTVRTRGIPHTRTSEWEAVRMAVQLFREVNRGRGGRGTVRWYKHLDVEALRRSLTRLDWRGSHLDVASQMVSGLITAHPFPNANHRTSIFLARKYLVAADIEWPRYSLRGRGIQRFHQDTKEYFIQSKYLLQIYRHKSLIRAAWEAGYDSLHIGHEAEAPIRTADLRLNRRSLRERHLAATRNMFLSLASQAQIKALHAPRTKALREWVQAVQKRD